MKDEQKLPSMSPKEELIVGMIIGRGESYGLELVKASDGELARGTIYVTLGRMIDKGFLTSREEETEDPRAGMKRRLYQVTGFGQRVFKERQTRRAKLIGGLSWT